jgi:hypothetical protein
MLRNAVSKNADFSIRADREPASNVTEASAQQS